MLAVTGVAYPKNLYLNSRNIRDYTKVYYISHLLDQYSSSTSEKTFLNVASNYFSQIDISKIAPPKYNLLQATIDYYDRLIISNEPKIELLSNELDRKKYTLNEYDSQEVDEYNNQIKQYNNLLTVQKSNLYAYNTKVEEQNNMQIVRRCIVSIGGGINLKPNEFKKISRNKNSPRIREIKELKSKMKTVGKITKSGNWIRNQATGVKGSIINKLAINSWISSKSRNENIEYTYRSKSGDYAFASHNKDPKEWRYETVINGNKDVVKYSKTSNRIQVSHGDLKNEYTGRILSNGKRVEFFK